MVWPMRGDSASITTRPRMSIVLPAEKGTMARITLSFGQTSACARRTKAGAAIAAEVSARNRRRCMRMDRLLSEQKPMMTLRCEVRKSRTCDDMKFALLRRSSVADAQLHARLALIAVDGDIARDVKAAAAAVDE